MSKKILAIEDDADALGLICVTLIRAGFSVIAAENGKLGLEKAKSEKPDLIVLDVMLPEVSGLDIIRSLKKETPTAKIPILMLTAMTKEVDRVVGFELGADDYLVKPFSPREMVLRIEAILRRQYARPEAD